jgi:hypothetical protein
MVMDTEQLVIMQIISNVLLLVMGTICFFYILTSLPQRKRRWRLYRQSLFSQGRSAPKFLLKLLLIEPGKILEEREQILRGCGIMMESLIYEIFRRLMLILMLIIVGIGYIALEQPYLTFFINPVYVIAVGASLGIIIFFDRKLLEQFKAGRAHRIVKEIYIVSHHLLYYSSSKMNLHHKLSRCTSQTRTIRPVIQLMLNEWYQDPELAIRGFKQRLGTDEAHSFGETLNALRLHEDDSYYELLRQRIQDYKEKIDLAKESRKETVSYLLFILAGLPILNTFRIFMYPWVIEGQRLFNSIN